MVSNKQLTAYGLIIFSVSWGLQLLGIYFSGNVQSESIRLWFVALMFTPALITLLFSIKHPVFRSKLLWKPSTFFISTSLIAILIPAISGFLTLAAIQWSGKGQSEWFQFSISSVLVKGGPFLLGSGHQSWLLFSANVLITACFYAILNVVVISGEELAWRGFLQGELCRRFGYTKGILLLGVIWSLWHLPAQLAGYNFPENPILGAFVLSTILLTAFSFFLGWLTVKSKSFIPAALAHSAYNTIEEGVISSITLKTPLLYEHIVKISITIIVGFIFYRLTKKWPDTVKNQKSN